VEDQSTLQLCPPCLENGHRTNFDSTNVSEPNVNREGVQTGFEPTSIPMMYIQNDVFIILQFQIYIINMKDYVI
jgi:hypothetical protein